MKKKLIRYPEGATDLYFNASITLLNKLVEPAASVFITDEHVFAAHSSLFKQRHVIILKPGEAFKTLATVEAVVQQLLEMQADRSFTLVGVGGGVITDLTGYIASVYMRGIRFGFVPTTLLAMVDASVGGKNGVDLSVYKNIVGLVKQPSFIVYMPKLLRTLPEAEWRNGFAEIIKHASIGDASMFRLLSAHRIRSFQTNHTKLNALIEKNVLLKTRIVQKDPFEHGVRRLLNFGHTVGHALENQYTLSHGEAISIGMTCAALVSEHVAAFRDAEKLIALLDRYGLPTYVKFDADKVMNVLKMDKKRERAALHYVVLERIGKATTLPVSLTALLHYLKSFQA